MLTAVLLLAPAGAQGATRPGVFAGTLGLKVPKGAHATVRAVDAAGGRVVAARDVARSGAFSLSLPPGPYVVRGVVVPRRGAPVTKSIPVSLKAGQRRTRAKLTARRRKRSRPRASAAFVTERGDVRLGSVAVGIHPFTGPPADTDLGAFARGFADLLTVDVLSQAASRCSGHVTLREVARLADALREFRLGQSPYADKATFPKRNLILVDVDVNGRLSVLPDGTAQVAITITDARTGAALGTLDAPLGSDVFAGEERVAGQLTSQLCKLSETFKVTLDVKGEGRFATHNAAGTIHEVLMARRSGSAWSATGPLQWQNVVFSPKLDCPYVNVIAPVVSWSVRITDEGHGLSLLWNRTGNDGTTASIDCPPDDNGDDPPPVPGEPGPALLNIAPETFALPYRGRTQPLSGIVQDGGDGFFNSGSITVAPAGITAPG